MPRGDSTPARYLVDDRNVLAHSRLVAYQVKALLNSAPLQTLFKFVKFAPIRAIRAYSNHLQIREIRTNSCHSCLFQPASNS